MSHNTSFGWEEKFLLTLGLSRSILGPIFHWILYHNLTWFNILLSVLSFCIVYLLIEYEIKIAAFLGILYWLLDFISSFFFYKNLLSIINLIYAILGLTASITLFFSQVLESSEKRLKQKNKKRLEHQLQKYEPKYQQLIQEHLIPIEEKLGKMEETEGLNATILYFKSHRGKYIDLAQQDRHDQIMHSLKNRNPDHEEDLTKIEKKIDQIEKTAGAKQAFEYLQTQKTRYIMQNEEIRFSKISEELFIKAINEESKKEP